jgi:hypothetical protein
MKFQNLDTGRPIEAIDGYTKFFLPDPSGAVDDDRRKTCLSILQQSWPGYKERFIASDAPDIVWADSLDSYLLGEAEARIKYIKTWLDVNTNRFSDIITMDHMTARHLIDALRRVLSSMSMARR